MEIIRIPRIMQDTSRALLMKGRSLGLVPTMGALHDGHMSLVKASLGDNHYTVASIFVNPSQFGPGEDLERYPRDADGDITRLRGAGVDVLFMPEAKAMYPEGFSALVHMGAIAERLCGAFRPGHFEGVATVVAKLFNITMPTRAYFGLKDYQQTLVIQRLVRDLNFPVEVVTCPTLREPDGLAMSSRNRYLGPEERKAASAIYALLEEAGEALKAGRAAPEVSSRLRDALAALPLVREVQYAGAFDPEGLAELAEFEGRALLAAALVLGDTRLIDNVLI